MPEALLDFARAENVTQVVLGASNRPRSRQLLRPSVINRVIRDSGPIDVHVISMSRRRPMHRCGRPRSGLSARRRAYGSLFALITLPLLTVLLTAFRDRVGVSTVLLMYLLIVVGTAAIGGLWPALAAAVASSLLTNYYFVPPITRGRSRNPSICSRSSCSSRSRPW
jgi:two-component system sensor histidine kinase KdpD